MSIYGAMFSGVSGLAAQSQALAMISDNISNVNTVGYKGTTARFHTLVTEAASATMYSSGGVRSLPLQNVDRQGLLQGSASPTDVAIIGNGFFVVNEDASPGIGDNYLYTRAGNFRTDENGNLVSSAGYYLQGWRLDSEGNLPSGTNLPTSLTTVNVANLTGAASATTLVEIAQNLPVQSDINQNYSTSIQLYDKQGAKQNLDVIWQKTGANTWALLTALPGSAQFASDDTAGASLTDASTTYYPHAALATEDEFSLDSAAGDVDGAVGAFNVSTAGTTSTITVDIGGVTYTATVTTDGTGAADLQNGDQLAFTAAGGRSFTLDVDGSTSYDLDDATGQSNLQTNLDNAFANVSFDNGAVVGTQIATVTFNADGTLGSITASGPASVNTSNRIEFYVDYDGDAATTSNQDRQLVALDIGSPDIGDGMTSYEGEFYTKTLDQDGLSFGSFTGVTIDENGIVTALFDNGQQRDIFKLPIATFRNPNGLEAVNGNAYLATGRSGDVLLQEANAGGAGTVAPSSLESSTVDLAEQFTNMIVTQRAYSASAKIITTSDEMLEELVRIRR